MAASRLEWEVSFDQEKVFASLSPRQFSGTRFSTRLFFASKIAVSPHLSITTSRRYNLKRINMRLYFHSTAKTPHKASPWPLKFYSS
jgi:hypothetical protein